MLPIEDPYLILDELAVFVSQDYLGRLNRGQVLGILLKDFWAGKLNVSIRQGGPTLTRRELLLQAFTASQREWNMAASRAKPYNAMNLMFRDWLSFVLEHPRGDRFPEWDDDDYKIAFRRAAGLKLNQQHAVCAGILFDACISRDQFGAYCDLRGNGRPAFWFRKEPAGRSTAGALTGCRAWLVEQVRRGKRGPKAVYWAEAQKLFPRLSRRGFEAAWSSAVPGDWKQPGAQRPSASEPRPTASAD